MMMEAVVEILMSASKAITLAMVAILISGNAFAAAPIIYPAKGQSAEQQNRDQYECHQWAVQQTGFDPSNPSSASQASASDQRRGPLLGKGSQPNAVRGGARGAALGAVGGAIAGDAGKGAAAGAAVGGLGGAIRRRDQANSTAANAASTPSGLDSYNRALAACMTGRGYSVK
jgi:YMGG-like Gly-zipper